MKKFQYLSDLIDELKSVKDNLDEFMDTDPIEFIRKHQGSFRGETHYSTWKILIDESKSMFYCRDAQGFKTINKPEFIQRVYAPANTKEILLAKIKKDRNVAIAILDGIAKKKYNGKLGE